MAEFDTLTGIYNKQTFFYSTSKLIEAHPDETFAFYRFDINRFNLINSFYGAKEGDNLLRYMAEQIDLFLSEQEKLRSFGRIEADIFGFCIPYRNAKYVAYVTETIQNRLRRYPLNYYILLTFGIYVIRDTEIPMHSVFDCANLAAKSCKGRVVDNFCIFTEEMGIKLRKEQQLVADMNAAIKNGDFEAYYQPTYTLATGKQSGAEALVRKRRSDGSMMMPGEFIPVFERNGFVPKVDFCVWERVCDFLGRQIKSGIEPKPVSVNVSRINLYNPRLPYIISGLADSYGVPRTLLHLEMTESIFVDEVNLICDMIKKLRACGFYLLMDDFGSGYSSLNMLKDIEIDAIKIDMHFLESTENVERALTIIKGVINLAHSLNIEIVAEGVETKEQAEFLKEQGCTYAQGYLYAAPMSESEYVRLHIGEEE